MTTDELVEEIFGRCRERIDRGESVDVDEVVRAHPDLAHPLRARFAAARLVERAGARQRAGRTDGAAATRVGTALGPYRIESVLGAGGMGTVYLASAGGARVALKVFHPHLVARERFVARFQREAELGRYVRHPNVVRTLDAGEAVEEDRAVRWLVMEHVEGRTLRALLSEMGRLPEELCRHVGREVAQGLAAIHAAGAVHRDLKPENVIVTKDHVVKVMDLGVARVEDAATLSETGAFIGSLRYGAPEQLGFRSAAGAEEAIPRSPVRAKGDPVDHRADLHALGLVLHELATGVHPFVGDEFGEVVRQILDVRPRRCGELVPQLSPFFEELVAQLLEKDREKRPDSAAAVAAILAEGEESSWWKQRAWAMRRETKRPLRRIRIPRETALYGRDAEIAKLRALFDRAKAGEGRAVLVEGEAGIGKSRLVDEFVLSLWAAGEDLDFLFGSYPPGGAATASGAFSTAYREHLGDDEAAIKDALAQTPILVPAFAALLRGEIAPERAEKLTKDSLQTVFVHATRSFAAKRTTIVFIDDLHFAPEEGRALFAALALAVPGHRVLLVGAARPTLDEKWVAQIERLEHATRVALPRLGARDLIELLVDALKSRHLAEELAAKIATKSDGNPFFAFEILRGLREGQFLTRKPDGTWITTRAIQDIDVPTSIVDVIQARVSDLDAEDRNALEVAACVGFEFDAAIVGAVLRVEPIPLLQRLGRIEKAHRLVRSVGHRFAFDHHQVQEVLYAGLSPPLREAYHASIAEAIEQRSGAASKEPKDLDGALSVDLAEHFLHGAKGERGLRYLDAALTHFELRWQNDAAVRLCDRALEAPGLLTGSGRGELLVLLAKVLDRLGRRERQRAAAESLLKLAREIGDERLEATAVGCLVAHSVRIGQYADATAYCERALGLMRKVGDQPGEARMINNLGNVAYSVGRLTEATERYETSLALANAIGERQHEMVAMGNLGTLWYSRGEIAKSLEYYEGALALARENGDRQYESGAIGSLGNAFASMGRLAEARQHQESGVHLARKTGNRVNEAVAVGNLGITLTYLGRLDDAQRAFETEAALAREIADVRLKSQALAGLGAVATQQGDASSAERLLSDALDIRRAVGARGDEAQALLERGTSRDCTGDVDGASADLAHALSLAREVGLPSVEVTASARLARLSAGHLAQALAALAAHAERIPVMDTMEARLFVWLATTDRAHLVEAKRLLDYMIDYAPPDCRESMTTNVRLHREILSACREQGL